MDPKTIIEVILAVAICVAGVIYLWFHPSRRTHDPNELVTVAEFLNVNDARMWKMRLQSQGVQCTIIGDISNTWAERVDLGSIRLQVLGNDVARAQRILRES